MANEIKKHTTFAPFAYDNEYYIYVNREKAEKEKFVSFMTQREASYKEPAQEVYNYKKLNDKDLIWESFRENIEPPTPQIKKIDGYKSEEEISNSETEDNGEENDNENGEENGDENNNNTPLEP